MLSLTVPDVIQAIWPAVGVAINRTLYCNAVHDNYLCWPPTPAGETVYLNCPPEHLSDTSHSAFRTCGENGQWLGRRPGETSWTNYTPCFPSEAQKLLKMVYGEGGDAQNKFGVAFGTRYMECVGIILSIITLLISLFIFIRYTSLRNNRTRIHRDLIISMLVHLLIRLVLYIDQAYNRRDNTDVVRGIHDMPYVCITLYILLEYTISVMFMWMFIEGLYLHSVVSANSLRERIPYQYYYIVGWGFPLVTTAVWATMTALHYRDEPINTCWYGYNFLAVYWIVQGPRVAAIVVNFLFLLSITRVLVLKMQQSNNSEMEITLYATPSYYNWLEHVEDFNLHVSAKAVKAALVLLPLLGITNILNMIEVPVSSSVWKFALWSYSTHFLRSFQGFFIALIYCFMNGEVRMAVRKDYENFMAMRSKPRQPRSSSTIGRRYAMDDQLEPDSSWVQIRKIQSLGAVKRISDSDSEIGAGPRNTYDEDSSSENEMAVKVITEAEVNYQRDNSNKMGADSPLMRMSKMQPPPVHYQIVSETSKSKTRSRPRNMYREEFSENLTSIKVIPAAEVNTPRDIITL
ncbi:unnamed protein product, partial [Iphiclides podalirius]